MELMEKWRQQAIYNSQSENSKKFTVKILIKKLINDSDFQDENMALTVNLGNLSDHEVKLTKNSDDNKD